MKIFTLDRAERLAKAMEAAGFTVRRDQRDVNEILRNVGYLAVASAPYATVWKGNDLRMTIHYEWISERSALL